MCAWLKTAILEPLGCVCFAVHWFQISWELYLGFVMPWFLCGWVLCLVFGWDCWGWGWELIAFFFFFGFIPQKAYDFFFLVAQHLLGWWCCPSDRWYGNSEAIPTWSWGVDRWNGTCECASVPGQSSNFLSFPQQLGMVTGLARPSSIPAGQWEHRPCWDCWGLAKKRCLVLLLIQSYCRTQSKAGRWGIWQRMWLPVSQMRGFTNQSTRYFLSSSLFSGMRQEKCLSGENGLIGPGTIKCIEETFPNPNFQFS